MVLELEAGQQKGYDVPVPAPYPWLHVVEPTAMPSAWLALDLGAGELAAMALALEHPEKVVLLDDTPARRIAQAAGLQVWGTLKVLLEAKSQGLTEAIAINTSVLSGRETGESGVRSGVDGEDY